MSQRPLTDEEKATLATLNDNVNRYMIKGGRVQVIVDGCVQFDRHVDEVEVTAIMHDDPAWEQPCEMQFGMKYGARRPDGTIEV
jgi:hypothetical protein